MAAGILVSLWTWAAQNAYNGDLSACSDRVIANACRWKKDAGKLVQALQECGWMDGRQLHDWDEYAELYIQQQENRREKTRERVRNFRERKKLEGDNSAQEGGRMVSAPTDKTENGRMVSAPTGVTNAECNGYSNVTVMPCNAPTIPNHTIPDHTVPATSYSEDKNILSTSLREEKSSERSSLNPAARARGEGEAGTENGGGYSAGWIPPIPGMKDEDLPYIKYRRRKNMKVTPVSIQRARQMWNEGKREEIP